MLQLRLDAEQLCSTLAALEPVQLKGLALLQSGQRPLGLLGYQPDIPRETLREAVLELISYTDACARAIQRLLAVPAIPLTAFPTVEWVL
jgi:hypothetical protein